MAPSRAAPTKGAAVKPRSTHLNDPNLQPFLASTFDPTEYLNSTLPYLSISTRSQPSKTHDGAIALPELSAQTQTVVSQLNALTTRLSNTLTQLTDEILRSGSRLTYEVEVLRGESINLSETLTERLTDDVKMFVPNGLSVSPGHLGADATSRTEPTHNRTRSSVQPLEASKDLVPATLQDQDPTLPPYMTQLRTLSLVKSRLDTVIKIFGDAMDWTLPPSEVSLGSSFISVSAPEPGSESHSREEKGQEVAKRLRAEITDILHSQGDGEDALEAAIVRVEEIRELAQVWKGTVEEKARMKFVEGLIRLIEERQKELEKEAARKQVPERPSKGSPQKPSRSDQAAATDEQGRFGWPGRPGGYGLIDHLQKMRGGL